MYASGLQAKQDADKRREEMLTGKADVVLPPEKRVEETSRVRGWGHALPPKHRVGRQID